LNSALIIALHESGISVPSATTINGQLAIRAALFNHRTEVWDIDALLAACLRFGAELAQDAGDASYAFTGKKSPHRVRAEIYFF
jgi:hypothetical protein